MIAFRRPMRCAYLRTAIYFLFFLGESLFAQALPEPNLAHEKPVTASGPMWPNFTAASLTDGNPSTFTHPLASTETLGYYFEIDLGSVVPLDRIVVRNRGDGCCPQRLSNYAIELYDNNEGETGPRLWRAVVRSDGSNSGVGGVDIIRSDADPSGRFVGRFIRIVNINDAAYSPQVAEVEVYGSIVPTIKFDADIDAIAVGESATLRWEIIGGIAATISPQVGAVAPTNGFVQVTPNSTTTYTLTATNEAGSASATVTIGVDVPLDHPIITEFMADNESALKDEDGDFSDWIEITNPNDFAINLRNYYLTDNASIPKKWRFPDQYVRRRSSIVVFASEKNRALHTNFKLSADGDYLALVDAQGKVLQQIPATYPNPRSFPDQVADASYGIGSDGVVGFFRRPTPGETNGPAFSGIIADLRFSFERGFYDSNFVLQITCPTPGVSIRYTINRTEPTATIGIPYTNRVLIDRTTVLRVAAFRAGWSPTEPVTQSYIYLSNVIAATVMNKAITQNAAYQPHIRAGLLDIPSISMTTTSNINDTAEVKVALEWLRPDGEPGFQVDCGARLFGGAFTDFAKKNFRLYFRKSWGADKLKYPLFAGFDRGMAPANEFEQLELRSGSHDMSMRGFYMSNIFTDDTMLEMGRLNPHGRFVHLYFNGVYWGLYHLRERWGASMHESYLGGERSDYESINGNLNVGGWAEPGLAYDGDGHVWTQVKNLRNSYQSIKPWVDVPQYIDYMLMWMFGGAESEFRAVGPNVPGSGFKFYLNDADGWFCGPYYCQAGNRTTRGAPGRLDGDGPGSIFSTLVKESHPDFRILLADQIYKNFFEDGPLTVDRNRSRLVERCQEIERAFIAESARWNYITPAEWAARRDHALTNWLPRRTSEAFTQYRSAGFYPTVDAPQLDQQGDQIRFGASTADIYFTTDGSDPRNSPTVQIHRVKGDTQKLVTLGSNWRWFTDATGLGSSAIVAGSPEWSSANWKHWDFDDSSWPVGRAQFGYGENDEATQIPFGPDSTRKWTSSYFRHEFTVSNIVEIAELRIFIRRDDGAIVYLNGQESGRSGIVAGPVTGSTFADPAFDDGQLLLQIPVPLAHLVPGRNVLAVEIHQSTLNNPDASFDMELVATRNPPTNGLPLVQNTIIKARAKNGAEWSALNEAFFQAAPEPVTANELSIAELKLADGEFLELFNRGTNAINLTGVRFINGIDFTFPTNRDEILAPGQRIVLVKDLFNFQRRYGIEIPVSGIYRGGLSDDGETISLIDTNFELLSAFRYQTTQPWPYSEGHSLVFGGASNDPNDPAAWHASAQPGGTPGWTDELQFTGDPFADLDKDGSPSLLEYALGASDQDPNSGTGLDTAFDPAGNFYLTFSRNLRAGDVNIFAEFSENLRNWAPGVLLQSTNSGNGRALETWGMPNANKPILFVRLRAELR